MRRPTVPVKPRGPFGKSQDRIMKLQGNLFTLSQSPQTNERIF